MKRNNVCNDVSVVFALRFFACWFKTNNNLLLLFSPHLFFIFYFFSSQQYSLCLFSLLVLLCSHWRFLRTVAVHDYD